ncbi:hypothetical protein [Streptomyces sp. URMC 123]|uniref:hypothetical protein n=1 Tax=Streptomyces sp. URMC 123 TaxID=3423403 RepID=UPI003F19414A
MQNVNSAPERDGGRRRTALERVGLVALAVVVLLAGVVTGLIGPLLAISCPSCADGVRSPLFGDALIAVCWYVVPLVTVGTVAAMFLLRNGARAGRIGLGVLAALFFVELALGRITV